MKQENRRAFVGLFLILVGIVFLLNNFDLIPRLPWWVYQYTWQIVFMGAGVFLFISGNRSGGFIFLGIGTFFLLKEHFYLDMRDFWPVILIIVGLSFVFRHKRLTSNREINDNYFEAMNIFGGGNQIVSSPSLQGGRITSIFGGSEVDLRQSKAESGAIIEVTTIFGGSDITVPPDWKIKNQVTAILGGFEDKRTNISHDDDAPVIVIKGLTLFGGGEIKS
ncbi:MAG: putative membrane protein [Cyclobacteriaceae bacterium]|jgi:predicted membrane protein